VVVRDRLRLGKGPRDGICLAPPRLPLLVAFVVAAACGRADDTALPGGVGFLERDSAGVVLATTLGTRARVPIGWVVETIPEYQIGDAMGQEPYLFSGIQGTSQLSDGRVVVLDEASCEFRFFGQDGAFLERTGGIGDGPGEFKPTVRGCVWVPSPGTDSLRAFDGTRLSFFDDRGLFIRRLRTTWRGESVQDVLGTVGQRVLVVRRFFPISDEEGVSNDPSTADFALLEIESWQVAWEGFFQGRQLYTVPLPNSPYGRSLWDTPFDILPDAVLGWDGFFLTLGEDEGPEILEYDTSGRLRRVLRLAEPALAPSFEDIEKLVEFKLDPYDMADTTRKRITDSRKRRYGKMPLPKILPVFSRLLVDDVGWLWAELYRYDVRQPVRWLVFGPGGEGLGSVDMPPDLYVWQIGHDFVLGVWQDENEVEYVRRYALTGRR